MSRIRDIRAIPLERRLDRTYQGGTYPMWFELPLNPPEVKDGYMAVPQAPGLGVNLNPDVISRYRAAGA